MSRIYIDHRRGESLGCRTLVESGPSAAATQTRDSQCHRQQCHRLGNNAGSETLDCRQLVACGGRAVVIQKGFDVERVDDAVAVEIALVPPARLTEIQLQDLEVGKADLAVLVGVARGQG